MTLNDGSDVASAAALAKSADVAIVMVGLVQAEGHDFPIELPDAQDDLIAAVAAANPHTVIVLKTGAPC